MQISYKKENLFFVLFLMFFLLFPSAGYFRIYIIALNFACIFFLFDYSKPIQLNRPFFWVFCFMIFLVAAINFRHIFMRGFKTGNYIREFTELLRFSIVCFVLLSNLKFNEEKFRLFIKVLLVFMVLNSYVMYFEFFNRGSSNIIYTTLRTMYQAARHSDMVLYNMGISTTGALNGLILNIIHIIFLNLFNIEKNRKKSILYFIVMLASAMGVLTSGSRSNMIGLFVSNIVFLSVNQFFLKEKIKSSLYFFYFLGVVGLIYLISNIHNAGLIKLGLLFEDGGVSKGLEGREIFWNHYVATAEDYLLGIFIGWGKTFFIFEGNEFFFTDNDYLALILMFGVIPAFIYVTVLVFICVKAFLNKEKLSIYKRIQVYIICTFLVVSYATVGLNEIRFYVFIVIFYKFDVYYRQRLKNIRNDKTISNL